MVSDIDIENRAIVDNCILNLAYMITLCFWLFLRRSGFRDFRDAYSQEA